jgi:hypothetical protein
VSLRTTLGTGERAGNADLRDVLPASHLLLSLSESTLPDGFEKVKDYSKRLENEICESGIRTVKDALMRAGGTRILPVVVVNLSSFMVYTEDQNTIATNLVTLHLKGTMTASKTITHKSNELVVSDLCHLFFSLSILIISPTFDILKLIPHFTQNAGFTGVLRAWWGFYFH